MPEKPDSSQEKTEQPTAHRLQKALEEGKVSKSQELSSVAVISLGFAAMYMLGPAVVDQTTAFMRHIFNEAPRMTITQSSLAMLFRDSIGNFFLALGPFLLVMVAIGGLVNVAQVGFRISTKPLEPSFDKLNPINGFQKFFKARTLVEIARDSFKILIVCALGASIIISDLPDLMKLVDVSPEQIGKQFGLLALLMAMKISGALLILAIFDFAFQKYQYKKDLRMTKQEIREESKDTEGNPQVKSRIRQIQRQMSRQRMMSEVKNADVVITNPTHFAIVLKYDRDSMDAPRVIAKGQRLIALKIRELAQAAGIPVIENKPLARSLYQLCDVGQNIPATLYKAVAEVLAYVYQLKSKKQTVNS